MNKHQNFEQVSIRERLIFFLDSINEPIEEFLKKTGFSNSFLRQKSCSISSNNLFIISKIYEDLNLEWLITGKGSHSKLGSDRQIKLNFNKSVKIGKITIEQLIESQENISKYFESTVIEVKKALRENNKFIYHLKSIIRVNEKSGSV